MSLGEYFTFAPHAIVIHIYLNILTYRKLRKTQTSPDKARQGKTKQAAPKQEGVLLYWKIPDRHRTSYWRYTRCTFVHDVHILWDILHCFFVEVVSSVAWWISNNIHYKVWGEITYPFVNFNGRTIEVWEWISNSIHNLPCMWLIIHAGIKK